MNVRPVLVIRTETRLVRSSRPLPQAPCTGVAAASMVLMTAPPSPAPPLTETGPPELGGPLAGVRAEEGTSRTVSQPEPVVLTPGAALPVEAPVSPPFIVTWV